LPLERPEHIIGVEVARRLEAIDTGMKLHAAAELEGDGLAASVTVQLSARPGSTNVERAANAVSLSNMGRAASKLVPVVFKAGVKFSGETFRAIDKRLGPRH